MYIPRLWLWAVRHHPAARPALFAEAVVVLAFVGTAIGLAIAGTTIVPLAYAGLAYAGSWAFPLATAYLPHTPAGRSPVFQTRWFRGWVARLIAADHLYHLEHHLYPAVPHHRWPELARRLAPHLARLGVPAVRIGG